MVQELEAYHALCNAPEGTPHEAMIQVCALRWPIETMFEQAKQFVGLNEYETRTWLGWHHHMTLVILAFGFLARCQRRILRIPLFVMTFVMTFRMRFSAIVDRAIAHVIVDVCYDASTTVSTPKPLFRCVGDCWMMASQADHCGLYRVAVLLADLAVERRPHARTHFFVTHTQIDLVERKSGETDNDFEPKR